MKKSGLADSPFFASPIKQPVPTPPSDEPIQAFAVPQEATEPTKPQIHARNEKNASTKAAQTYHPTLIDHIRKIVKVTGKEVSFIRLTPEEKNALMDIVFTYKRQGVKTTENEINRIALNFLIQDYKANAQNSILASVIAALLA